MPFTLVYTFNQESDFFNLKKKTYLKKQCEKYK